MLKLFIQEQSARLLLISTVLAFGGGYEVVRNAFIFADRYAPDAELYYNDFNVWRPAHVDGIVTMVRKLQEEGIRIDGVGIQAHWGFTDDSSWKNGYPVPGRTNYPLLWNRDYTLHKALQSVLAIPQQ